MWRSLLFYYITSHICFTHSKFYSWRINKTFFVFYWLLTCLLGCIPNCCQWFRVYGNSLLMLSSKKVYEKTFNLFSLIDFLLILFSTEDFKKNYTFSLFGIFCWQCFECMKIVSLFCSVQRFVIPSASLESFVGSALSVWK